MCVLERQKERHEEREGKRERIKEGEKGEREREREKGREIKFNVLYKGGPNILKYLDRGEVLIF